MLIWNAWRWLRGTVTFRAEGGLCEQFLTRLQALDPPLAVWDIRREESAVTLCCQAANYARLRPLARRTGTRVRAIKKNGLPFRAKPLTARMGILLGAAIALVLYMILSSRIWIVDVQVDDPVLAARIETVLAENGVGIGSHMRDADVPSLRMRAIAEIKEINQLSLYFDGSIARVGVQLQKESASPPDTTPSNLVAARDGRIVTMRTTIGQPMVMEGEAVVKGDLLVCGAVETEQGTLLRHASAVVLAETTHTFEERVSLHELLPCEGRVIEQPSLYILSWRIPLYSQAAFDETWTVTTERRFLTLFGTALPLGIESEIYTEQTQTAVTHTREEAEQLARERLEARAAAQLGEAQINDIALEGVWEGEVYCLRAVYECTEDIAVPIPLNIAEKG